VKRTLLAAALLVTSVFGVTGCGSDDDVAVESRVKNVAQEASGASDAMSQADCNLRYFIPLLVLLDDFDLSETWDFSDRYDLREFYDLFDGLELLLDRRRIDQCDAASKSGYFDDEGNWRPDAASDSGYFDDEGNWRPDAASDSGYFDDEGNWRAGDAPKGDDVERKEP
jgi:hypothetical protein